MSAVIDVLESQSDGGGIWFNRWNILKNAQYRGPTRNNTQDALENKINGIAFLG